MLTSADELESAFAQTALAEWVPALQQACKTALNGRKHGDAEKWQAAIDALPEITAAEVATDTAVVTADCDPPLPDETRNALRETLQSLLPWRKGPFRIHGIDIETEWHSDWKWERLIGQVTPLEGRMVLDVGCGSGYHCFRMQGAGARAVLGVDPFPLFHYQFHAIQNYIKAPAVAHLPVTLEQLPTPMRVFDTVFSMGVLYHHRSPVEHLQRLRQYLKPGGELVLETLVIEGDDHATLVPEDRYARMRNVWFIPSCAAAEKWLRRTGFTDIRVIEQNVTSVDEQRTTDWMPFESLASTLDPEDSSRTIEGYPAPRRATLLAKAK